MSFATSTYLRSHELTLHEVLQQHIVGWTPSMHTLVSTWQDGSPKGTVDW